jgi:plastocyanin
VLGPEDITIKNRRIFVLQGATGLIDSWPKSWPNGIYEVKFDGALELFVDLTAWLNAHPATHPLGDQNELGEPLRILAADGGFWVLESNRGEVLWVTDAGEVSRIADFSARHEVWTALAPAPDDGVSVGTFTPAPHFDGDSRVMHVTRDGNIETVWTGLTTVTDLVVAPDGTLYALEMATGNADGMRAGTGRIVRQTGPSSLAEVATGLDYPIAMKLGPDGALYVVMPAYGPNDLAGAILRIEPGRAEPVEVDLTILAGARCRGAASYAPPEAPAPTASLAPTGAPVATTPEQQSATANLAGAVAVPIVDFTYEPAELQVAVGTTVVWTNDDTAPHTVTALDGAFNSGNMNLSETWSYTFTSPGDVPYVCLYHPLMTGTVKVR